MLADAGVTINEIRAIGGGAKSEKWLQIKSDIFGKKVVSLNVTEGACLGAIILAGTAIGKYTSVQEAVKQLVKPKKTYLPNVDRKKLYDEKFKTFYKIYPALKEINYKL
jgi:xylulokinase